MPLYANANDNVFMYSFHFCFLFPFDGDANSLNCFALLIGLQLLADFVIPFYSFLSFGLCNFNCFKGGLSFYRCSTILMKQVVELLFGSLVKNYSGLHVGSGGVKIQKKIGPYYYQSSTIYWSKQAKQTAIHLRVQMTTTI